MKTISLKLPEALHTKLASTAKRTGRSKSDLTREAIEAFLEGQKGLRRSCLDLSRDLAGSLEGPTDLASNKNLLEGYGE